MRKLISVFLLTLVFLVAIDLGVATVLGQFEKRGMAGAIVRYFEYGRSVPGKLARWEVTPGAPGNLYDVGWMVNAADDTLLGPDAPSGVVRIYGMSFVNNILREAGAIDPDLPLDRHTGPGAPPNYTYAVFLDDAPQRNPGDVAVLGILSSSVPALAALSNRTWVFEQPSPFTYPVFRPDDGDGLRRIDPLVTSPDQQRALADDPQAAAAWRAQLAREDAFYGAPTFALPVLDHSPFARLVRRSLGVGFVDDRKRAVLDPDSRHGFPYEEVLKRMVTTFAETARADGQVPMVILVQTRDLSDPDLGAFLGPVLDANDIPYLATADYVDPGDHTNFVSDGHYTRANDRIFGQAFLDFYNGAIRAR